MGTKGTASANVPSRFAEKLLKAVRGEKGLVEPSFVYLPGVPGGPEIAKKTGCDFFSVPIELGVSFYSAVLSFPAAPVLIYETAQRCGEGYRRHWRHHREGEEATGGVC